MEKLSKITFWIFFPYMKQYKIECNGKNIQNNLLDIFSSMENVSRFWQTSLKSSYKSKLNKVKYS